LLQLELLANVFLLIKNVGKIKNVINAFFVLKLKKRKKRFFTSTGTGMVFYLPTLLVWSIIGCTIRRRAFINLQQPQIKHDQRQYQRVRLALCTEQH